MVIALAAACHSTVALPALATGQLAIDLSAPADLWESEDAMWAMPDVIERRRARAAISIALAADLERSIDPVRPALASALLARWLGLWHDDPEQLRDDLTAHRRLLEQLRELFARSGESESALLTLIALVEVDPAQEPRYRAEIDDVLAFAEVTTTSTIETADHTASAALQLAVRTLPLRWVVDVFLERVETQIHSADRVLPSALRSSFTGARIGRSMSYQIAAALAHGHRLTELNGSLRRLLRDHVDPDLERLARAIDRNPGPEEFLAVAAALRRGPSVTPAAAAENSAAALAVLESVLERFPGHAALFASAGELGESMGRLDQALLRYRAALMIEPQNEPQNRVIRLRIAGVLGKQVERAAGRADLHRGMVKLTELLRWRDRYGALATTATWGKRVSAARAAIGSALLADGSFDDAMEMLRAALPDRNATLALSRAWIAVGRYREAAELTRRALADPAGSDGDEFAPETDPPQSDLDRHATRDRQVQRAELEFVLGEALRGARGSALGTVAARPYYQSLRRWIGLGEPRELPRPLQARRWLALGRVMWWLGEPASSIELLQRAAATAGDDLAIAAAAVEFLISVDRYPQALDLYRRSLELANSDDRNVVMGLWLLSEARHRGWTVDPAIPAYLTSRTGRQWRDLLARAAVGRTSLAELRHAAVNRPRSVELAFYSAALGLDSQRPATALLTQVVDARLVTQFETQLARRYLRSLAPRRAP